MTEMPTFETALRLGELFSIIFGGGLVFFRLGKALSTFEEQNKQHGAEIKAIKEEIAAVNRTLVSVAVQDQKIADLASRQGRMERLVDDLRRGEGYVLPLGNSGRGPQGG